jgi:HK97 family phage portal protein
MGIIDKLIARAIDQYIKAQGGDSPPGFLLETADNERHSVPDSTLVTNQLELYQRLSWVADAVGYPSRFAASMSLDVYERQGEDIEEVVNHPFEILLQQPNPTQSRFTLFESTFANNLLTGNAYWFLNKTSENEPPIEIYSLPPDRIRPIADGKVDIVAGYEWDAGKGESIFLEEWEVVHFKEYHARNMFVGLSRTESISNESNTEVAAAEYDLNFYGKDNAKPEGILSIKGHMEDVQFEALKRKFKRRHGGTKRELAMVQGPDTVDYIQMALNYTDMDFINNRTFKKEMIYNHFAPGLASILAVNATEANARQGKQTLLEFGIWPMLVNIHEQITNKIMNSYGENLIAKFKDVRQVDRELELSELAAMSQTHKIDELRQMFWNIDPLGDERGEMLPVQISSATPLPGDEEEEETPAEIPPQFIAQQQEPPPEEEDEEEEPEEGKSLKAIADIEHLFKAEVQDLIDGALSGALTRQQFTGRFRGVIARFAKSAYREGLVAGGVESGELSDEDNRIVISFIREQQSYAKNLAEQIYSDNVTEAQAGQKSTIWYSKSIEPAFQKGLLSADANGMYEWQLGTTEEHCRDCLRLDGQRHRLKDWAKSGWLPRSDSLECNGFNCDCVLLPTRGKARGRLGKMQEHVHDEPDEATIELAAWKKFVKKRARRGELFADMKEFEVYHIDDETAEAIRGKLADATNADELRAVFRESENG